MTKWRTWSEDGLMGAIKGSKTKKAEYLFINQVLGLISVKWFYIIFC